ncbi:hypothetical protein ACRV89_004738 [Salmonella enterica subsp. enterica serovar Newport]
MARSKAPRKRKPGKHSKYTSPDMTLYQYPKRWLVSLPPEFDEEEPVELFYDTPEEAIHYCIRKRRLSTVWQILKFLRG